jgi:SulP family sulfate permease
MTDATTRKVAGDFWGGLAAMLVALPSAIAFGVTIFSALGPSYAAQGALAGILGATALGLVASYLGGTNRLITAPCAPAAAVLSAFAIQFVQAGTDPATVLVMMSVIGLLTGALQLTYGLIGVGRLIKYMPYPVVSGYLSGVGLIIILSQIPKLLGVPKGMSLEHSLVSPGAWNWQGIAVGVATAVVMIAAPRFTKVVPAAILGLAAGVLTYFGLSLADASLLSVKDNALVIGPLSSAGGAGGEGAGFVETLTTRWKSVGAFDLSLFGSLLVPALTLSVLLSIDTLKTCVVLDSLTRSRHNSNRELVGQGLGNLASTVLGGIPGAGTMGATLVNISSGAQTRLSGLIEGGLALVAFLLLGSLIAWIPIATLAAILIVIGVRMFDVHSLQLLRNRSTVLDFVVIVAVVAVAETVSLIAASGTGIALAVLLFIREKVSTSAVRRKVYGNQVFSKQIRLPEERALLEERGEQTVVFELQGSLFFGTTDQLFTAFEPELGRCQYLILDLRRVQSVDVTAAHMLEQVKDMLADRGAWLIFSDLPRKVPTGQNMAEYFDQIGLAHPERHAQVFPELDDALEWVENRILAEAGKSALDEAPLELREIDLFAGRKAETLAELEAAMDKRSLGAGESVFAQGDDGDELFLIRRGSVRIELPLEDGQKHHVATFGRGDFFGEMSFLDHSERSANAVTEVETELFVLSRAKFDAVTAAHHRLGINLIEGLARVLAVRLRYTNAELRTLQAS